ncbi:hypothetical protein SFRURICE_006200 [Spodoptera frugiperda]|nr:hypothetical protein SFRURICE_006200 [Spodoptera frugiperda]
MLQKTYVRMHHIGKGRRCYSAHVWAQTQMHSLFPLSLNPMGRRTDRTGEGSGAGPTEMSLSLFGRRGNRARDTLYTSL